MIKSVIEGKLLIWKRRLLGQCLWHGPACTPEWHAHQKTQDPEPSGEWEPAACPIAKDQPFGYKHVHDEHCAGESFSHER